MRLFKVFLAIFLVIVIALSSIFFTRSSVVTSLVNDYLIQYNSKISCIDFTLNADFDLVIAKLCIDSPYADLELTGILIEWYFEPQYLTLDNVVEAISLITINSVDVIAKADISFAEKPNQSSKQLDELPSKIRKLMHEIANYTVPLALNINTFNYLPFVNGDGKTKTNKQMNNPINQGYQGRLSANSKKILLSLTDNEQTQVLSLKLARKGTDFSANINTDLATLSAFIKLHRSALPAVLSTPLATLLDNLIYSSRDSSIGSSIDKKNAIMGEFSSQINWHNHTLSMANTLSNFSFRAERSIETLGPVKVDAVLAWQFYLAGENLQIDFAKNNVINVVAEQENLTALLSARVGNKKLQDFIKDNPINTVSIELIDSINVDFNTQSLVIGGISLTSENLTKPFTLSLNEIMLNYTDKPLKSFDLLQAKFTLKGLAKVTQLQPYNNKPVKLTLVGDISQKMHTWQVALAQGTAIEISQLSLKKNIAKSLISHWQGELLFEKSNIRNKTGNNSENKTKSEKKNTTDVIFNLQVNNQISQLNLPKVMQVKRLELNAKLSGSVNDIVINSQMIFDELPVATVKLTGDVRQPKVVVSARDILLTDILALKLKSPISLKLIDGTLSYQLSGQLKNNKNVMANPMLLAVSVKDVTGEVDGTWLQELNWHQKFSVINGQIKSLIANTAGYAEGKGKAETNLTVAKIETATAITQLSANTLIDFSEGEINVRAKSISGNLLDGRFEIDQLQWPFSKGSAANVKLTKIDLEKLLELDKKQGIVVTGKVSGNFPIFYDGEFFLINEGHLYNVGDGLIQVFNNPAVEELKSSSTELNLAFSALENLHYHHLTSEVSMADDGYMLLVTEIKGRNPDLDNEVNLNLNLSYDLLGLLESLNITEHFENKVIKGLQH